MTRHELEQLMAVTLDWAERGINLTTASDRELNEAEIRISDELDKLARLCRPSLFTRLRLWFDKVEQEVRDMEIWDRW